MDVKGKGGKPPDWCQSFQPGQSRCKDGFIQNCACYTESMLVRPNCCSEFYAHVELPITGEPFAEAKERNKARGDRDGQGKGRR